MTTLRSPPISRSPEVTAFFDSLTNTISYVVRTLTLMRARSIPSWTSTTPPAGSPMMAPTDHPPHRGAPARSSG